MNFQGEVVKIAEYNVSALANWVKGFDDARWCEDTSRQKIFEAHTDTQTIKLIFDADYRHTNPTSHAILQEGAALIEPIQDLVRQNYSKSVRQKKMIRKHGPGYFVRMILTRLSPGSAITPHVDTGQSLSCCHRIHVPLVSNQDCSFTVGNSKTHLSVGGVWEINNRLMHAVENKSDEARIHLIMDYVQPGEVVHDHDGLMIA